MTCTESKNIPDELVSLEHKLDTLEGVMKIAQSIERLQEGLQSVLLLGKSSSQISKSAIQTFQNLSEQTKILPTLKLQSSLVNLDKIVQLRLAKIMSLTNDGNTQENTLQIIQLAGVHNDHDEAYINQLLNDFRRSAQTAVALRILLKERGTFTKPIDLTINKDSITQQLQDLKQQEKSYREKVVKGICDLQEDAILIFKNTNLPLESRKIAKTMYDFLQKDLVHIKAGKKIEDMPMAIEILDEQHSAEIILEDEISKPVGTKQEPKNPVPPPQFRKKLWRWLTTPTDVTWKDVNKS